MKELAKGKKAELDLIAALTDEATLAAATKLSRVVKTTTRK
jgi:hypothetical protein